MTVIEITTYRDVKYHYVRHVEQPALFQGLSFDNCEFIGCVLMQAVDPTYPIRVSDVSLKDCRESNNSVTGVRFENVTVQNVKTIASPFVQSGCVYKNVVLRGRVGEWMFSDMDPSLDEAVRRAFLDSQREFYHGVDVALDISEAVFVSADIYNIPGDLVKRDPETQFLVRKSNLEDVDLSQFDIPMKYQLKRVMEHQFDSMVIVAGKAGKNFSRRLEQFERLVELGIAER